MRKAFVAVVLTKWPMFEVLQFSFGNRGRNVQKEGRFQGGCIAGICCWVLKINTCCSSSKVSSVTQFGSQQSSLMNSGQAKRLLKVMLATSSALAGLAWSSLGSLILYQRQKQVSKIPGNRNGYEEGRLEYRWSDWNLLENLA